MHHVEDRGVGADPQRRLPDACPPTKEPLVSGQKYHSNLAVKELYSLTITGTEGRTGKLKL
jgi:hypothetical protein